MAREKLGFIRTGIMGEPMARNMLKAGFPLTIHNRTKAKAAVYQRKMPEKRIQSSGGEWWMRR